MAGVILNFLEQQNSTLCDGAPGTAGHSDSLIPEVGTGHGSAIFALALSGLTGIKAFVPLFVMAVGKETMQGKFPFCISDEGKLILRGRGPIKTTTILTLIEMFVDSVPCLAHASHVIMGFVKPTVSVIIALAPSYNSENGGGPRGFDFAIAVLCAVLTLAVAWTKQLVSLLTDAGSHGLATPMRSLCETVSVFALGMSMFVVSALIALAFALAYLLGFIYLFYWAWRKVKKKVKKITNTQSGPEELPASGPEKLPAAVEHEDEYSDESDEEEERVSIFCSCLFCIIIRKLMKIKRKLEALRAADARSMTASPLPAPDLSGPLLGER